jgi:4'-phosphopantetheinyl transferase
MDLAAHAADVPLLESLLDSDEARRCRRFATEDLKRRFIVRHGMLRLVLASYLPVAPSQIELGVARNGKPVVLRPVTSLRFNLSDSDNRAVIGVADGAEIGIDLERIRCDRPPFEILPQLAPGERRSIESAGPQQRIHALYRTWTRKEAVLKACGDGLGFELSQFEVPAATDRHWQLRFAGKIWYAVDLGGLEAFSGCLVLSSPIAALSERLITGLSASMMPTSSRISRDPLDNTVQSVI